MPFKLSNIFFLGEEIGKLGIGEYTSWSNLLKQIRRSIWAFAVIFITLILLLFSSAYIKRSIHASLNASTLSTTSPSGSSIFNNLSWIDIFNSHYKGLEKASGVTQDNLFLMAIYVLIIKSIFFLCFASLIIYALKFRQGYSLYIRRRMPRVKLETRSEIPTLALDVALNPFPISAYLQLKKWNLPNRQQNVSWEKIVNSLMEKQSFPKWPNYKTSSPLVTIKNLCFMYHGDNEWDQTLHRILKKFFPTIYKWHILSTNTINKEQAEEKKDDPTILKNISLTINTGKFTTILGCNGSSKSTFLKAIIHLFEKYSGTITWIKKDLKDISIKSFYRNIAYVAQENIMHSEISVYDYVACGLFPSFKFFKFNYPKNDPTILENLRKMEILKHKDTNIKNLSGGERQKAILARVLTQKTKVIILDEPTTYLDINNQYKILNLLKKLQLEENKTIIAILHDLQQAKQFSDEVILLDNGKVFAYGETPKVINKTNIEKVFGVPWN